MYGKMFPDCFVQYMKTLSERQVLSMSRQKKSKAVPVVLIITILLAALCVGCFYFGHWVDERNATKAADAQDRLDEMNRKLDEEYAIAMADYEQQTAETPNQAWPAAGSEGWNVVDLTGYPLESPAYASMARTEIMNNGLLLINPWHDRPLDFSDTELVSVSKYTSKEVQATDNNVLLFPQAADAIRAAVKDAKAENLTHYMVSEGYRSFETQQTLFTNKMAKLSDKYSGDALEEAAAKEVNRPGQSEFNSGLSFTLKLYDKNDKSVGQSKYSPTDQAKWMNENCWKYGLVFRFPLQGWPLESSTTKEFVTGISSQLNLYRYVGKGNAAAMHAMDLCLEEYIAYLCEHPHIAVFEDGQLRYEIVRQDVGDATAFDVLITTKTSVYTSSLDNMGGVVTVFEY